MSTSRCNDHRHPPVTGNVDAFCSLQHLFVFTPAAMIKDQSEMKPVRMVRIELHCPACHFCSTVKLSCHYQHCSKRCQSIAVPWIQRDGTIDSCGKCRQITL